MSAAPTAGWVSVRSLNASGTTRSIGGGAVGARLGVEPTPAPASVDGFAGSVPAAYLAPGSSAVVNLLATAPHQPGSYLLVVDLVTSDGTSLAAAGVPPLLVRVVVVPVAAESAAPTLAPGTSP
jgi:hypothetical protein